MLGYAGREIEGTSPWAREVGVGDFKTLIIILRDRAEAEIIFLPHRRRFEIAAVLASCDINRKSPRSNSMISLAHTGILDIGPA